MAAAGMKESLGPVEVGTFSEPKPIVAFSTGCRCRGAFSAPFDLHAGCIRRGRTGGALRPGRANCAAR
jgi:hypothetical protein